MAEKILVTAKASEAFGATEKEFEIELPEGCSLVKDSDIEVSIDISKFVFDGEEHDITDAVIAELSKIKPNTLRVNNELLMERMGSLSGNTFQISTLFVVFLNGGEIDSMSQTRIMLNNQTRKYTATNAAI